MIRNLILLLSATAIAGFAQSACESLASLKLTDAKITAAELVAAGPARPQGAAAAAPAAPAAQGKGKAQAKGGGAAAQTPTMLPSYCRIAATLMPSSDSDIKMELWMPASDWNGKFEEVGGGGWA